LKRLGYVGLYSLNNRNLQTNGLVLNGGMIVANTLYHKKKSMITFWKLSLGPGMKE